VVSLNSTAVRQAQAPSQSRVARRWPADLFYSAASVKTAKTRLADTQPGQAGIIKIQKVEFNSNLCRCLFVSALQICRQIFAQCAQN